MNDIDRWLRSGAGADEGLRLLDVYAPSRWLPRLVRASPRHAYLLRGRLLPFAEESHGQGSRMSDALAGQARGGFRKRWPFLNERDCPAELKILAADLVTAWHAFVDGHERLYSCATAEGAFATARDVMENYMEYRRILSEFSYYKEHRQVLGKHPVFAERVRLAAIRGMTVSELFKKRENLLGAIWRIKSGIGKGDRPDLEPERLRRLEAKRRELEEVERIISDYDRRDTRDGKAD